MAPLVRSDRTHCAGYTLVEAMLALALTAMAGTAVLLTIETSLDANGQAQEKTIALGMAEQLLDQVVGSEFDDLDGYNGFVAQPPQDPWGAPLGQGDDEGDLRHASFRAPADAFRRWRQQIEVYPVDEDDPSVRLPAGQTSDYRGVEAIISRQNNDGQYVELARLKRIVTRIPTAQ